MSAKNAAAPRAATASDTMAVLRRQYGCGPVELTGSTLAPGAYVAVACAVSLLIAVRTPETGDRALA